MILIFHYVGARDRTCVPLTPLFRLRDARLSARQDARGSRYLRLHAHLPRYFSNTTSLAHARAACASVASSTCPHMCRETAFSRVRSLRSIFSRAPCGHRYPHLQGQLERVRSAPPAAHSARAIDPRMRLSMLFYAAVRTDHSRQRAPFLLCLPPANDLWLYEYLRLELRTVASRFGAAEGRVCFRFHHFMFDRCLLGSSKSAQFAPWDKCEAC